MDETSSDRWSKETKILSTFLQKTQESKKPHSTPDLPEQKSNKFPPQEPILEQSREEKSPLSESVQEPASNDYPHLSPEAAQLIRKMTDSANRQPIRSLRKNWETEEEPRIDQQVIDKPIIEKSPLPQKSLPPEQNTNFNNDQEILFPNSPVMPSVSATVPVSPSLPPQEPEVKPVAPRLPVQPALAQQWEKMTQLNPLPDTPIVEDSFSTEEVQKSKKGEIVVVSNLHKGYVKGKIWIPVLRGVDFSVHQGEYLSIVGQSGSGKSTLLHLIGTLDIPDNGMVHFDGQRIDNLPSRQRDLLRNRYIGMIFQFYHLIPEMTMIENVLAPLMIREGVFSYLSHRKQYRARAQELLEMVGLGHRIRHKPNELSGGEMQRTAIARALITEPRILLADEPTGNLDSRTSNEIVKLLRSLNQEQKLTIIMVTHDTAQAEDADRYIRLVDGQIAETVQKR